LHKYYNLFFKKGQVSLFSYS